MRAFEFELSRRGFASALAAGALSLALVGCGGGAAEAGSAAGSAATDGAGAAAGPVEVRVASLKGPTSIGLVQFMDQAASGETDNEFDFAISAAADEIVPKVIQGDVDIALVPANAASVLYNKTEGAVQVIDINTLGVLSVVTGDASVTSFGDLAGHAVYMTGKGTTPEYVMNYLLERAGLTGQVALEFKSEPTEVLSALLADPSAVGVLPEPFKTAAVAKSEGKLSAPVSLTDVWDELAGDTGSRLLTGVTVVRRAFAEEIPDTTKLIIAQRVSSIQNADRIIVMDNGEINGFGTHEELLKTNAIYQEVFHSQTGGAGDFDEGGEPA